MDYKLKVFQEVAITKSFSQASRKLNLSQPAVSKTIKKLEEEYGRAFFYRDSNQISLTDDGLVFLEYAEKILRLYHQINDEFFDDKVPSGDIKIGASTTIANYILPKLIASLQKSHPQININLEVGNTNDIQRSILKKEMDFGIIEGDNHYTRLNYKKFIKDELVLVSKNSQATAETIAVSEFINLPLIGRENGSGTREVVENTLRKKQLNIQDYHSIFGSTESMKTYLFHSDLYAFLSVYAIQQELKEGRLRIIDIEGLEINRWFYFITRQGFQSKLLSKLQNLLVKAYNRKE